MAQLVNSFTVLIRTGGTRNSAILRVSRLTPSLRDETGADRLQNLPQLALQ